MPHTKDSYQESNQVSSTLKTNFYMKEILNFRTILVTLDNVRTVRNRTACQISSPKAIALPKRNLAAKGREAKQKNRL